MKQHINPDDLNEITDSQKQRLCKLWVPRLYDLAVAAICLDAENDKYQQFEFVIGNVIVQNHYHGVRVTLCNLQVPTRDGAIKIDNDLEDEAVATMESSSGEEDSSSEESSSDEGEEQESAYEMGIRDLSFFNKDECLPLLSIGQMLDMLRQHREEKSDFFVTIPSGDASGIVGEDEKYTYGTGNPWSNYQVEYEGEELCDILWECVKEIL